VMDDMINQLSSKEEQGKEDKMEKRLVDIEVKEVMNDLINKIAIDNMDKKFEQSIFDIVNNLS
jgi:hypothetical protein